MSRFLEHMSLHIQSEESSRTSGKGLDTDV
jgi:hypothetical protein